MRMMCPTLVLILPRCQLDIYMYNRYQTAIHSRFYSVARWERYFVKSCSTDILRIRNIYIHY
jgi:hypothetical protein